MVALHELGAGGLSREREMAIWKKVRHALVLGSTPARIAEYALSQGLDARLWVRSGPGRGAIRGKTPVQRLLHRYLHRVYSRTAARHRRLGHPLAEYREEPELLGLLRPEMGSESIHLVYDNDEILHFILVRRHGGDLWVMDPDPGTNRRFGEEEFLRTLGPRMVGYAVLMHRGDPDRPGTAATGAARAPFSRRANGL